MTRASPSSSRFSTPPRSPPVPRSSAPAPGRVIRGRAAMNDLSRYLYDKRALVDEQLRASVRAGGGCPVSLAEAMCYSLLAPGKRLRPLLTILAAEACGGSDLAALPV